MAKNEEAGATGLPAGVETAWGLRERTPRGPARGLDVPRIVEAAVAVADAEGLGAVSMGRVAKGVGVSTMALYRYVAGKDDLLILMEDAAIGSPPQGPPVEDGWRAGLEFWSHGIRVAYERHPWVMRIPISTPPLSPHSVEWMELALSYLRGTGLSAEERLGVLTLLGGYVRQQVSLSTDIKLAAEEDGGTWENVERRYWTLLDRLTDRERFPAITELLESGGLGGQDGAETEEEGTTFEFGLARILDGFEALMAERGGEAGGVGGAGESGEGERGTL
ncbi:TetR/AcrR family transcriptional regulator C-terminal domain-containing protein [Streptomyces sp. NPDC048172]|uniref:TetR/AcrR family transcriptional regulator C-terminal domain-containing protein n=1 Tax=Streptomyces sp. NPDC048172 TaxID=3365505 RepID=UPI00371AB37A